MMFSMWNGRVVCVAWLLCASLTAAFLDSVPDPPAIKQLSDKSQSLDFAEQLQTAADHTWQTRVDRPETPRAAMWPALDGTVEIPGSVVDSPLMRQAADPSPPAPVH